MMLNEFNFLFNKMRRSVFIHFGSFAVSLMHERLLLNTQTIVFHRALTSLNRYSTDFI